MKHFIYAVLIGITLVSISSAKTVIDKNVHKEYDVKEGASLYLKHGDGNVNITSWSRDVVDIDIVYHATIIGMSRIKPKDFEVEFEKRGNRISVIGREPQVIGLGSHRVHEYRYTIKAPSYVLLDIDGVDGNVSIEEWQNDIKVKSIDGNIVLNRVEASVVDVGSVDGDLSLDEISGDVKAKTVDGNINIEDIDDTICRCKTVDGNISVEGGAGSFDAESVDGNISLDDIDALDINAHTTDGRIELGLLKSDDMDATLRTGDGSVHVRLADGSSVAIEIKTGDGRIRTNLSPVADLSTSDNSFRGAINGGRGSLYIRTGDGNVHIVEE